MIRQFVMKNLSTLEEVTFGQDIDCDYVYESGGLDWNNIPATHNTYNYPGQIGDSISSSKINNRDITIEAYAYYVLSEDERAELGRDWIEYAYDKIKEKKETLNRIINPLDTVRITVGNYYIEGKPSATVKYGVTEYDNNIYFCKFLISIFCANPMFKKITQSVMLLSGDFGTFFFPLAIPTTGYKFGVRVNYLSLVVENEGNSEIGAKIILTAKDYIQVPTILNESNGQQFTIHKNLNAGEKVVINTSDGSEKGVIGTYQGVTSSYLKYWDFAQNDWMKFKPGFSTVSYTTLNQAEDKLDVKIEINPEKYGLEDM